MMSSNIPLFLSKVAAGFPSPADDYIESLLDLNKLLVHHPAATFFIRTDNIPLPVGLHKGDLLVVDKSLTAKHNDIVVVFYQGEWLIRRYLKQGNRKSLSVDSPRILPKIVNPDSDFLIWGVVLHSIHSF